MIAKSDGVVAILVKGGAQFQILFGAGNNALLAALASVGVNNHQKLWVRLLAADLFTQFPTQTVRSGLRLIKRGIRLSSLIMRLFERKFLDYVPERLRELAERLTKNVLVRLSSSWQEHVHL